jgi:hypothetical protein
MAIEKTVERYEFLCRFRGGALVGAHVLHLERIVDTETGQVYAETVMPAEPVNPATIGNLIGEHVAGMMEQIAGLIADKAMLEDAAGKLVQQVVALEASLAEVQKDAAS